MKSSRSWKTLIITVACVFFPRNISAQSLSLPAGRSYGRAVVVSKTGIVATTQVLASQAGAQVLARGGSAVDAAIAANAVLSVLEPMMAGPGGDLFAIYRDAKTGEISGLNASGWAPTGLTIDYLKQKGIQRMPTHGIFSVTVPGCVDGWEKLHRRFGRLPWKDLFAPAIYLADNGFPISDNIAQVWKLGFAASCTDEECRRAFGAALRQAGDFFKNQELAAALKLIAEHGAAALYRGPIADAILRTSARLGGTMTKSDLEDFTSEWVKPISSTYRGWTIYELPPNSRGAAVLESLNILGTFPAQMMGVANADAVHRRIEAMRLAYADIQYVADPRTSKVPITDVATAEYARKRAALIDPEHAHCDVKPGDAAMLPGDTTYLTVVDRDGNIISLIQSLATGMSGVVADAMGFVLQNRGSYFSLDPHQPNALAPRKRVSHTLVPALLEKDNLHVGIGFVGGPIQVMAQMQVISNIADWGMDLQAALEAPRFFSFDQGPNCKVVVESRIPVETRDALARMGHRLELTAEYQGLAGIGQAVSFDTATGTKYGASDPRGDGAAIPEPLPK
jgi:gamma-glutamyltranspeptidase/glutathione hydrolase